MSFLSTGEIPEDADAPGLKEAKERLLYTARGEGKLEGRAEGRAESLREVAQNLKHIGMNVQDIIKATGLTVEEIEVLKLFPLPSNLSLQPPSMHRFVLYHLKWGNDITVLSRSKKCDRWFI